MDNKELKDKELNKANGGYEICEEVFICPSCCYEASIVAFSPERTGSGCDIVYHYTCPACGYKWETKG